MMGLDTPETCRGWRTIPRISCASSRFFFTQENNLLWLAHGPLCFALSCHMTAMSHNPINLMFSYKRTTKNWKRVNTFQDYSLHVCITMYYTQVSNLYSLVRLVGCSNSCCCPLKKYCLTTVPLNYHIIRLFLPLWNISFEIPHFLIGTGGWFELQ